MAEKDSDKQEGLAFRIGLSGDVDGKIKKLMEEAKKAPGPKGPFIYGFNLRFDGKGKPVVQEFGNVSADGLHQPELREPLTDVIETPQNVTVVAELPGVEEKDVDVKVSEDALSIRVDTRDRKYMKNIKLSCRVDAKSAKSWCRNGVLQIQLNRVR